jgi:hypothetical protein
VTSPAGTWTELAAARRTAAPLDIGIWAWQNNTRTSADTITVTISGTDNIAVILYEWLGAPTTGTLWDTQGDSTATGTAVSTASDASTTSGQRLAIYSFTPSTTQTSVTYNTSYIGRFTNLSATFMAWGSETREFAGGGTETATATLSTSSPWVATLGVLLADTGGGGGTTGPPVGSLALLGVGT